MTYRSESRGIMYTAPPSGDDADDRLEESTGDAPAGWRDEPPEALSDGAIETSEETDGETEAPSLEPTTATTDANWTGSVPADD